MDTVLFKAKRILNGEWIEGLPSFIPEIGKTFFRYSLKHNGEHIGISFAEVLPETICQFTGNTGPIKIFKGDIVEYETEEGVVRARVVLKEGGDQDEFITGFAYEVIKVFPDRELEGSNGYQVIGNIHD